jgi:putative phage-type endonuclease
VTFRQVVPVQAGSAEWRSIRAGDVTSTEVAALYDASPYLTPFELWHRKSRREAGEFQASTRMKWGTRLEPVIAHAAAEEHGWSDVEPYKNYIRLPVHRAGSSFDFVARVDGHDSLIECKNVGLDRVRHGWVFDGDELREAPLHIELQVQHQLVVSGIQTAHIAVLVGGNSLHVLRRERDAGIAADILRRVDEFWVSVDAGKSPAATTEDADFVIRSLRAQAGDHSVTCDALEVVEDLREYSVLGEQLKTLEAQRDAAKARVLLAVGDAGSVVTPIGKVSCGMTKDNPGKLVTADMVGTYVGARAGFRQFRFTPNKAK